MKEINQSVSKKLGPVELYKEDLEDILNILKEGGYSSIFLESGKFEYRDDELDKLKINNSFLLIRTHSPSYLTITFDDGVRIYSANDSISSIGVVHKIELLLKKRLRHVLYFLTNLYTGLIFTIIVGLTLGKIFNEPYFILLIYGLVFIPLLFLGEKIRKNILNLFERSSINWFQKNIDALIVGLIVTIAGGLILKYV